MAGEPKLLLIAKLIQQIGTIKQVKNLKKIIHLAIARDWMQRDPFVDFKCTYKETNRGYLIHEELDALQQKQFSIKRLEMVRDIFIFCCYTGLAYSDVAALTKDDITTGIDGEKWVIIYRHKKVADPLFHYFPRHWE